MHAVVSIITCLTVTRTFSLYHYQTLIQPKLLPFQHISVPTAAQGTSTLHAAWHEGTGSSTRSHTHLQKVMGLHTISTCTPTVNPEAGPGSRPTACQLRHQLPCTSTQVSRCAASNACCLHTTLHLTAVSCGQGTWRQLSSHWRPTHSACTARQMSVRLADKWHPQSNIGPASPAAGDSCSPNPKNCHMPHQVLTSNMSAHTLGPNRPPPDGSQGLCVNAALLMP